MKEKFKRLYMKFAEDVSELSYAERLKVGAVIVKDDRVISFGYNGMPSGWDNECEIREYYYHDDNHQPDDDWIKETYPIREYGGRPYKLVTKRECLHAESNAIAKLARSPESGLGASLFITHSPCMECAKLIHQTGISSVFFKHRYRDESGINFLEKSDIYIEEIN